MTSPEYEIIRSRRKTLSIRVEPDARVTVRAPLRMSESAIRAFVSRNLSWIQRNREACLERLARQASGTDGDTVFVRGVACTVESVPESALRLSGDRLLVPHDCDDRRFLIRSWLREAAEAPVRAQVAFYARLMNLTPAAVKITGASRQWGSCSGRNSLCFSWRVACLPDDLLDAVVVHELAHIREKNHSKHFYSVIYQVMPDYDDRHRRLREFSRLLTV